MDNDEAVGAFAALGQATRLKTYRALVQAGPEGMRATDIADRLRVPRNTMSTHLGILLRSTLITSERSGATIIYRANIPALAKLNSFLFKIVATGGAGSASLKFLKSLLSVRAVDWPGSGLR